MLWFLQRSTSARLEHTAFVGAAFSSSNLHAHQQQNSATSGKTRRDASTNFQRIAKCFGRHGRGTVHPAGGTATLVAPRMCASRVRESSSLGSVDTRAGFSKNVGACVYALDSRTLLVFCLCTIRESNASSDKSPVSHISPGGYCSIATLVLCSVQGCQFRQFS